MRYIPFLFLLIQLGVLNGQDFKQEQEFRIGADLVPEKAFHWIEDVQLDGEKVKWYFEKSGSKESYEAKFKRNKSKYSIEFSKTGDIEDVEIQRSWKELTPELRALLQNSFGQFEKFKIKKIQEQWLSSNDDLLKLALSSNDASNLEVNYEIEFRAKIDGRFFFWEGLFDHKGKLIKKQRIKTRATDNLDF